MVAGSRVLLLGFPNVGKTSLFNLLTGGFGKVANYSGITVDRKRGYLEVNQKEFPIELVDLPGILSLNPSSFDEAVTLDYLFNLKGDKIYHYILMVLDYQRLEVSLGLALAIKKVVGDHLALIINKDDEGDFNDIEREYISQRLGVRVFSVSTLKKEKAELESFLQNLDLSKEVKVQDYNSHCLPILQYFSNEKSKGGEWSLNFQNGQYFQDDCSDDLLNEVENHQREARDIINGCRELYDNHIQKTSKIDQIILRPWPGSMIFFFVFYFIFESVYRFSLPAMDLIDNVIISAGNFIDGHLASGMLKSLIIDGLMGGIGGVIIFLPQIMILFFLLNLLEQSGYIARAAAITDKMMEYFGLSGKAFLPYMSGFACAIPGIIATRSIADPRERIASIMTIPLVTCSARLPVYILLIGTFIPATKVLGIFNAQALAFFFLYFLGGFSALFMAKLFRLSLFKGTSKTL